VRGTARTIGAISRPEMRAAASAMIYMMMRCRVARHALRYGNSVRVIGSRHARFAPVSFRRCRARAIACSARGAAEQMLRARRREPIHHACKRVRVAIHQTGSAASD